MSIQVEVQARNIKLTEKIESHVNTKAGKLDHYLPAIEEARIEFTHYQSARNSSDRNVAQITVRGKGIVLRTEERAEEALAAFDAALDNMQRQIERYKGKHYHNRGSGRAGTENDANFVDETGELTPLIAKRKKFMILPMNEDEAIEQMRLLGHDNFFIFYNGDTSKINVLYRRRNGSYGLIEPVVG
jgi:putative sigma-54 modulation protein